MGIKKKILVKTLKGVTLIEVLLYVGLFSAMTGILVGFMIVSSQTRARNTTVSTVDSEANLILETISRTARNAQSITTPTIGSSGSSLSVVVDTGSLSPTVFSLSSGRVQMAEGAGSPIFISSNNVTVTSLTFRNLSVSSTNKIVRVEMTMKYNNSSTRKEYNYTQNYYSSSSLR